MNKLKLWCKDFWLDTKIMAKANPKKAAFIILVAAMLGFLIGLLV